MNLRLFIYCFAGDMTAFTLVMFLLILWFSENKRSPNTWAKWRRLILYSEAITIACWFLYYWILKNMIIGL